MFAFFLCDTRGYKEKFETIDELREYIEMSNQMEFSLSFSNEEDGLIKIESDKGGSVYKLKLLNELFSPGNDKATVIDWKDQHYMPLLYTIERAIKKVYEENHYRLTDSNVIPVLGTLAIKPETINNNNLLKTINQKLRLQLSMNDYSRQEVKMVIRKILNSARRHNKQGGLRGYLNFILEYVHKVYP